MSVFSDLFRPANQAETRRAEILPGQSSDHWWQVRAVTELAADGYVHQETRLWTREGRLALVGRQVVAVFPAGQGKTD